MGSIEYVSDDQFDSQVLKSDGPVVVDFTATWCTPCKAIAVMLDGAAPDYDGKVQIYKMDIDQNHGTPMKYMVRGVPTLLLFKDGQVVGQRTGAMNRRAFDDFVGEALP